MSNFNLTWHNPIPLSPSPTLTYTVDDITKIPESAGLYVFLRSHGASQIPMYVGKAENLRARVQSHFKTSVKLMNGIKMAPRGSRQVVVGVFNPRKGQQLKASLSRMERALIRHYGESYDLMNTQGRHVVIETLTSDRPQQINELVPRKLAFERHS